jgi:hypothetical protein
MNGKWKSSFASIPFSSQAIAMAVRASEEQGMPMLCVPIEHNVNSDRVCDRG